MINFPQCCDTVGEWSPERNVQLPISR